MMPIIHDLALHFETMNFDWIERKQNLVADMLAKKAAAMSVGAKLDQPDFFKVEFSLQKLMSTYKI